MNGAMAYNVKPLEFTNVEILATPAICLGRTAIPCTPDDCNVATGSVSLPKHVVMTPSDGGQ